MGAVMYDFRIDMSNIKKCHWCRRIFNGAEWWWHPAKSLHPLCSHHCSHPRRWIQVSWGLTGPVKVNEGLSSQRKWAGRPLLHCLCLLETYGDLLSLRRQGSCLLFPCHKQSCRRVEAVLPTLFHFLYKASSLSSSCPHLSSTHPKYYWLWWGLEVYSKQVPLWDIGKTVYYFFLKKSSFHGYVWW